jgi:omega-amidase
MKVSIIQTALHWEDPEKNRNHFSQLIDSIEEGRDLIVLPEMFTTGFTMDPERLAEPAYGTTFQWLSEKAKARNAVITGSVSVSEDNKYFNRLYWMEPDGNFRTYDKRHLFRMAGEDKHYSYGNEKIITSLKAWQVCPLICYDLRFPVWSRNKFNKVADTLAEVEYDLLLYVANWPAARSYAWKQLLIARAIENQCYVIGLNRVGLDGKGHEHSGDSIVVNPKGEIILSLIPNKEMIGNIDLSLDELNEFRRIFPVGLDADKFELI